MTGRRYGQFWMVFTIIVVATMIVVYGAPLWASLAMLSICVLGLILVSVL